MIIKKFELDLSSLPASGETRNITIIGEVGAEFILEITNEDNYYYNFITASFQPAIARLEASLSSSVYKNTVKFPVVGVDDQYNINLYAKPGTKHIDYTEVRFLDGTLDINSSVGSNSLMLNKVIYQYTALTLTISGYSPTGTVTATLTPDTISTSRGKSLSKTAFSFVATAAGTAAYRVLRQPISSDIISFLTPVVGAAPIDLPGENIYPTKTSSGKTGAVMSSTVTVTMADTIEDLGLKIGDKVIQETGPFFANIVTVVAITGGGLSANQFTASEAVSVGNDVMLDFYNRMNFSWPINNFAHLLQDGMIVMPGTNVTTDTTISSYRDSITIFPGTINEKTITKNKKPALSTLTKIPTIVKGLVTVQEGQIVFDKQQVLALAGSTLNVGGYGVSEVLKLYGWEIILTDLAIALTPPTTTTTEASAGGSSADITVASAEGIISNVSRISGIGINPALQNPLVTSVDFAGKDLTMDAVQTLENGVTLTIENTSRVATVTGNIEIIKAGTANQTIRFDIEKILSTSAPS